MTKMIWIDHGKNDLLVICRRCAPKNMYIYSINRHAQHVQQYTGCFRRNSKYFRRWQYVLFRV